MSSDKHKNRGIIPFAVLMDKPRMPQARTFPKQRIASKAENLIKTAKTELCCHKAWKTSQLQMFLTRVYTGYEAFLCFFLFSNTGLYQTPLKNTEELGTTRTSRASRSSTVWRQLQRHKAGRGWSTWLALVKQQRQPLQTTDGGSLRGAPPQEITRRTVSMTFSNVHNSKPTTLITLADGFALL